MSSVIFERSYEVNSFLVNPQKRLGLYALLNVLQDASWLHANIQGHGHESGLERKIFWVLTRQKLIMQEWPKWGSEIKIRTWLRLPSGPFAIRDFEISLNDRRVGECSTSWLMLNADTRKPVKDALPAVAQWARREETLTFDVPKIEPRTDTRDLTTFLVRNSDLDLNHHVNNTKYAQWVLDSIPVEWHTKFALHGYEVNFLQEVKSGDQVTIQFSEGEGRSGGPTWSHFQGARTSDGKTVFTARLNVSEAVG